MSFASARKGSLTSKTSILGGALGVVGVGIVGGFAKSVPECIDTTMKNAIRNRLINATSTSKSDLRAAVAAGRCTRYGGMQQGLLTHDATLTTLMSTDHGSTH